MFTVDMGKEITMVEEVTPGLFPNMTWWITYYVINSTINHLDVTYYMHNQWDTQA